MECMKISIVVLLVFSILISTADGFLLGTIPGLLKFLPFSGILTAGGLTALKLALGMKLLFLIGIFGKAGKDAIASHAFSEFISDGYAFAPHYPHFPTDYKSVNTYYPNYVKSPPVPKFQPGFGVGKKPTSTFVSRKGASYQGFDLSTASPAQMESFFVLIARLDSSKCISRMLCEVGAEPNVLEELGLTVKNAIGSLKEVSKTSKVHLYKETMEFGSEQGLAVCRLTFEMCNDEAYQLVLNFAKAFRVPKNIKRRS